MPKQKRDVLYIRAGDTDPLEVTVAAAGLTDLDNFASAVLYARKIGESANHVDGAAVTVVDSASLLVSFDPVGAGPGGVNAFDAGDEGIYDIVIRINWLNGDESRFPGEKELLLLSVSENYE